MLQVTDLCKQYKTGSLVQQALDHVSLSLRDNEFVAILGPSGSGKTTLLNVIGGLDRYDSGDLIINGVSTRKYKDRDWDSYRNHTIGFVFQSYNLVPHQTVLSNVELALTISGISGQQRRQRAAAALEKVGLGDQLHKLPNQMSGGQMQRVAIARALVNDPDIVLADEPTGALDTQNSVQIMDLLKEVAKDRLVVMVTHNPDLAKQYATRIVYLKDGKIQGDTNPYTVDEQITPEPVHRSFGHSAMNFLTALQLSFNNLRTKMRRTLLVAFAGSIGIVGIGLIRSLSNGVTGYIQTVEEQTLSQYPLEIMKSSFSIAGLMNESSDPTAMIHTDDRVHERQIVYEALSELSENDLSSFRTYLEREDCPIHEYASDVEYVYNVKPQIYSSFDGKVRQVCPDTTMDRLGFSGAAMASSSYAMSTESFFPLPKKKELYQEQYTIKAGHWPSSRNEMVLILSGYGNISDLLLYTMGLKNADELDAAVSAYSNQTSASIEPSEKVYDYDDFLGIHFKRINAGDLYTYDPDLGVYISKAEDADYVKQLVEQGEDLMITGVAVANNASEGSMLTMGIYYPDSLVDEVISEGKQTAIVQSQLASPQINVLSGKRFDDPQEMGGLDFEKLIRIDTGRMRQAFSIDSSSLQVNLKDADVSSLNISDAIDYNALSAQVPSMSQQDLLALFQDLNLKVDTQKMFELFQKLLQGYQNSDSFGNYSQAYLAYLNTDAARTILLNDIKEIIRASSSAVLTPEEVQAANQIFTDAYEKYLEEHPIQDGETISDSMQAFLQSDEGKAAAQQASSLLIDAMGSVELTPQQIDQVINDLNGGYQVFHDDPENHVSDAPASLQDSFSQYISSADAQTIIASSLEAIVNIDEVEHAFASKLGTMLSGYTQSAVQAISVAMENGARTLISQVGDEINGQLQDLARRLPGAIRINTSQFASAISLSMDEDQLMELFQSLLAGSSASLSDNLNKFGYAEQDDLYEVVIYPKDFASKQNIRTIIEQYNQSVIDAGEKSKQIVYTDLVATVMTSVTNIVNAIGAVLIGFVAISLVVSSIMIGVITYISVLERRKEIGILRALGASKHNVSSVFNAETFMIGLLSGLMGIGFTAALNPIVSHIIYIRTQVPDIRASLPLDFAAELIGLSIALTLLGGFLPSRKAADSDPVTALRTE